MKSLESFVTLAVLTAACASGSADAGRVRVFVGVGALSSIRSLRSRMTTHPSSPCRPIR